MASSKRLDLLRHLESTNQGHQISDILALLKEYGFIDTGRMSGTNSIYQNGDVTVLVFAENKHSYAPLDLQSRIIEACRTIEAIEEKAAKTFSPLKDILQKETDLVTKLEKDYGVTVTVNDKTGQIVFESKECNMRKVINHREQPFNLGKEIIEFTNQLDKILEARLEQLADLEEKSDKFIQDNGKETLYFGDTKVSIVYFGADFPTKDSLSNAQAAYERSLLPKEPAKILPNVAAPADKPLKAISPLDILDELAIAKQKETPKPSSTAPNAAAATPKVIIILGLSNQDTSGITPNFVQKPMVLDHTRRITGGDLSKENIEAKQRMWDVLKTIAQSKNDNVFLPIISEKLGMRQNAVRDFFDPEITSPPQRRAQSAMSAMQKKVFAFVKEAQDDKQIPRGTLKQFKDDFKAIKREIETAKEQWGRE